MVEAFGSSAVDELLLVPVLDMVQEEGFDIYIYLFIFVDEEGVTNSLPCLLDGYGILRGCTENSIVALIYVNMIGIATRGCSVGKGSDELASQRESGDVGNRSLATIVVCYLSPEGRLNIHACLFRGYLWINHRSTSNLYIVPPKFI